MSSPTDSPPPAPAPPRRRPPVLLAAVIAVAIVVVVVLLVTSSHKTPKAPSAGPTTTGPQASVPAPQPQTSAPAGSHSVVSYGADPTGSKDSTQAIRAAISDAQETPGGIVYFPAGRYVLDLNDGAKQDFEISDNPVSIVGAGRDTTTLVEEIGAKMDGVTTSKAIFQIVTGPNGSGGGDGTSFTGLTLDSASYDAGTTIVDFANNTTISNMTIRGPRSDKQYNRDQFGLRVIAVCNHGNLATKHRSGNRVENLILSGQGSAGNTDLDLSCQIGTSVSNVTDTGNGMDIYICDNIQVTNYTFMPGTVESSPKSYIITGPSDNITITNVTTYGSGGQFQPSPNGYSITHSTITNETMKDLSFDLTIGDAGDTTVANSTIGILRLNPAHSLSGLTVTNSSIASVVCTKRSLISGLTGIQC